MNKVILKGNLTRDPELKDVTVRSNETTVATFTLAVSDYYKKANGETVQDTEFIDCEAWDTGAVTIGKILHKGDPVLLEGKWKTEKWEDKDGNKRSRSKVRISSFDKLARYSKPENGNEAETSDTEQEDPELVSVGTDGEDIPF